MFLFFLFSCTDDYGCIDADNFGDVQKQRIEIDSSNKSNCEIKYPEEPIDTNTKYELISNTDLKKCLKGEEVTKYQITSQTDKIDCRLLVIQPSPTGQDELIKACENNCKKRCEHYVDESIWITNTPNTSGFGNSVNITPNSIIDISVEGSVFLGLSSLADRQNYCVKEDSSLIPNLYNNTCSVSAIPNSNLENNTNYFLNFYEIYYNSNSETNLQDTASMDKIINKLFLIHTKREDNTINCDISSLQDESNKINCSSNVISTDDKTKIGKYINFIRHNSFSEDPIKKELTLEGDILKYENGTNDVYFSLKMADASCNDFIFKELEIKDQSSNTLYKIDNSNQEIKLSNSSNYPPDNKEKVTLYANSTLYIKLDSTLNPNHESCKNQIKIFTYDFLDININESGFASFKIFPTTSGQCIFNGRIINKDGVKTKITDFSYSNSIYKNSPTTVANTQYQKGLFVYADALKKISSKSSTCISTNFQASIPSSNPINCNDGNGKLATIDMGGGGGGNIEGQPNIDGESFINPEFFDNISANQEIIKIDLSQAQNNSGKGGIDGDNGNPGSIELFSINSSGTDVQIQIATSINDSEQELTIAKSAITLNSQSKNLLKYKIIGAGGGGSACYNNGSNGDSFFGIIDLTTFFRNTPSINTLKLKLKAGKAGNGTQTCNIESKSENINLNKFEAFEFIDYSPSITYSENNNLIESNPYCQSNNFLTDIFTNIIPSGQNTGEIVLAKYSMNCQNGVGFDGKTSITGNGGGGSGGGNGSEIGGGENISNIISNNSKNGKSYYNPEFHEKKPDITTSPNTSGSILIKNNANTELYNTVRSPSEDFLLLDSNHTTIKYEICGGKGGNGGNNSGNLGACVTGELKNIQKVKLEFFKGEIGSSGILCSQGNNCFGSNSTQRSILKGGNGGNGASGSYGGGAGGSATIIYATIAGKKKILVIAGGGAGGYGGTRNASIQPWDSITSNDLLPYLQIKNDALYDLFFNLKYRIGNSKLENIQNKEIILDNSVTSHTFNAPTGYKISKIQFYSLGSPFTIGNNYIVNKNCNIEYSNSNNPIEAIKDCINQNICNIRYPSGFSVDTNCNASQNNKNISTGSGNGGGGGNIAGNKGVSPNPGQSGSSFFNKYYHNEPPIFLTNPTPDARIIIEFYKIDNTKIGNNHTITFSPNPSPLTIPSDTHYIRYEINGEKGQGTYGAFGSKLVGKIDKINSLTGSLEFFSIAGGSTTNGNVGGKGVGIKYNKNIIVIAGGGGGGGSSVSAPTNNIISDELSYFTDPKLAIKIEYIKTTSDIIVRNLKIGPSSDLLTISGNTNNSISMQGVGDEIIYDIIYAGLGQANFSNSNLFDFASCNSKDIIERIKVKCLGKKRCDFNINKEMIGEHSCSSPNDEFKIIYSTLTANNFKNQDSNTNLLRGGDGNATNGAGGSASYIAIERTDETSDTPNRTDYLVIAGGGSGGGKNAKISTYQNPKKTLENSSRGFLINSKTSSNPVVDNPNDMNYYEYNDNISANPIDDPLANIAVTSSDFSQKFYVRKNQILRLYPDSYSNNYTLSNGRQKKCTVGTIIKIDPRPAVICYNLNSSTTINNPKCLPKINTQTLAPGSATDQKCLPTYNCNDLTNNPTNYCPNTACSEPSCTYDPNPQAGSPYHICVAPILASLPATCVDTASNTYSKTTCISCQTNKINEIKNISEKIEITNPSKCYDFENSTNLSVHKYLLRKNINLNSNNDEIISADISTYKIKDITKSIFTIDSGKNVNYGNLSDYKIEMQLNTPIYSLKNPINFPIDGDLKGFVTVQKNFKDLTTAPSNKHQYSFSLTKNNEFTNGKNLEIRLCKNNSADGVECNATNIDNNTIARLAHGLASSPYKIENSKVKFSLPIPNYNNADINCTSDIYNKFPDKNFICYNLDKDSQDEIKKHRLAFKITDPNGDYLDNTGKYTVEIIVKEPSKYSTGGLVGNVLDPILLYLDGDPTQPNQNGMVSNFYNMLISSSYYQRILNFTLILGLTFYGVGYLIGINELKHSEIVKIIFKIGIIYLFTNPTFGLKWFETFFIKLFKDGVNELSFIVASTFDSSTELKNKITSGDFTNKIVLFKSVDNVLNLFTSTIVQNKILALIFSSVFGWVYFLIMCYCVLIYFYAIANSVLLFITCQIMLSIILVLGPIFFICLIFKITKDIFDNWIKALIGFGLQQIFLILTLAFFNNLVVSFLKLALGYRICWSEILSFDFKITKFSLLSFWTVAGTNAPDSYDELEPDTSFGSADNMPSIYLFLILMIIISIMKKFIEFFTNLAVSLAGGIKASSVGGEAAQMGKDIFNMAKSTAGKAYGATVGRALDNADNFLFASGKIAKQQKAADRKQFMQDMKTRATLNNEGKNAVSEYKKNNALELSTMSKSEQKERLQSVRDNAIKSYAKENGIKNLDKLMDSSGLNYTGTNLFGATFQAGKQAVFSGGALFNSLNDKNDVKASFSKKEAVDAIKNMNKSERDKFIKNIEEGNIYVNKNAIEKIRTPIKTIGNMFNKKINNIKSVGDSAYKKVAGDSVKSQAIKELENEGKIDKYNNYTNWARKDKEKKLIRDRMREIAKDKDAKEFKEKKVTSSSVIKDIKLQERFMNKENDYRNKASFAYERVKNFFSKTEKIDKKTLISNQVEKNKQAELNKIKLQLEGDKSKVQDPKNPNDPSIGLFEKRDLLKNEIKEINNVLKDNDNFKRFDNAEKLLNSLKENYLNTELKDQIKNGNDKDLKTIVNKIENLDKNKLTKPFKKFTLERELKSIMESEKDKNPNLDNYLNAREQKRSLLSEAINKIDRLENRKKIISS